jgi:hypothetical protein
MTTNSKRLMAALAFFLWTALILAAFYVTQKPSLLEGARAFIDTGWMLLVWAVLVTNAAGIGTLLIRKLPQLTLQHTERLLLSTGIGMGLQGLAGFLIGMLGWTHPAWLIGLQLGLLLLLWWCRDLQVVWVDLRSMAAVWRETMASAPNWLKIAVTATLLFAFLLALAPPAEAFDALFYHLVGPQRFLNSSGMQPSSVPHFWFPALPEGMFLWAQGLGADRTTQLLHLIWAVLTVFFLWYWAARVWHPNTAHASLIILLSMPSLYLLASWAYTDFALSFYALSAIYAVYKAFDLDSPVPQAGWIVIAGLAAGMSMGVKYTSFLVPVSVMLLTLWWGRRNLGSTFKSILVFSLAAVAIAAPWYLRSWFVMGNPFYPFAFGGQYWDAFRTDWYSQAGTGIGWQIKELFALPLNATLGYRDANYYDGRIGPLFLILAPLTVTVLLQARKQPFQPRRSLLAITIFGLLSMAAWVLGVINSAALWQTRLLFPALIPLALPTALGLLAIKNLDTPQLRLSFIFNFVVVAVVTVTVIDAGIHVLARNPLAYALGLETRQAYLSKVQPAYAQAMQLLESTPPDTSLYFLFEPRSYGATRQVQIDPILDNFAHDWYIHGDDESLVQDWRSRGYTHVMLYRRGVDFLSGDRSRSFKPEYQDALELIITNHLTLLETTPDGAYELYRINP